MAKITFMGAGSTVFARNVLGDCMCRESLKDSHIALYDIDGERLKESEYILNVINKNVNNGRAKITTHLGVRNRKAALRGADFVVNAIQVGGYEPSTVIDFEIPTEAFSLAITCMISGMAKAFCCMPTERARRRSGRWASWFLLPPSRRKMTHKMTARRSPYRLKRNKKRNGKGKQL